MRLHTPIQATYAALSVALVFAVGCASPGSPHPPSLNLPRPVSDLRAERVGDNVQLHWTMPAQTTDGRLLVGQKKVTICRRLAAGVCAQVKSFSEMPKAGVAVEDTLPAAMLKDAPRLLTYEVEVLNEAERSAGASNLAITASGAAPSPVNGLGAQVIEQGVVLRWEQAGNAGAEILLRREQVETAAAVATAKKSTNPFAPKSEPTEVMLRVSTDTGGTVDASAVFGEKYSYSAQRMKRLTLAGQSVEVRSVADAAVQVDVRDVFPPKPPQGLAGAEPVRGADGSYAVDISWDSNVEPDLAGYAVYRRETDANVQRAGQRMNTQLLAAPAFHDDGLKAGHTYAYSVSAVDKSGNESKRGAAMDVSIPQ